MPKLDAPVIAGFAADTDRDVFTLNGLNLTAGLLQVVKGTGISALGLPASLSAQIARLGDPWPTVAAKKPPACQSIKIPTGKLNGAQPLPADALPFGFPCAKCTVCMLDLASPCSGPLKLRAQAAKACANHASDWTADFVFTPACAVHAHPPSSQGRVSPSGRR